MNTTFQKDTYVPRPKMQRITDSVAAMVVRTQTNVMVEIDGNEIGIEPHKISAAMGMGGRIKKSTVEKMRRDIRKIPR